MVNCYSRSIEHSQSAFAPLQTELITWRAHTWGVTMHLLLKLGRRISPRRTCGAGMSMWADVLGAQTRGRNCGLFSWKVPQQQLPVPELAQVDWSAYGCGRRRDSCAVLPAAKGHATGPAPAIAAHRHQLVEQQLQGRVVLSRGEVMLAKGGGNDTRSVDRASLAA